MGKGVISFFKEHRILFHLLLMLIVVAALLFSLFPMLEKYTQHGVEVVVPDIKNLTEEEATPILERQTLKCMVIDSVYDVSRRPGIIIEQTPKPGSTVKAKKDIYVVINSLTPRSLSLPELKDISYRQALSLVEGMGFPTPDIEYTVSQYKDLVVKVKRRGVQVKAGDKYPITTKFTLVVGKGPNYNPNDSLFIQ